jgi:hypothetical protein
MEPINILVAATNPMQYRADVKKIGPLLFVERCHLQKAKAMMLSNYTSRYIVYTKETYRSTPSMQE